MAPTIVIIVINFLLILGAKNKSPEGREGRRPHYESGNMNCPCGGGYHPSGDQPWVRTVLSQDIVYIVKFIIKTRRDNHKIQWLQVLTADWKLCSELGRQKLKPFRDYPLCSVEQKMGEIAINSNWSHLNLYLVLDFSYSLTFLL